MVALTSELADVRVQPQWGVSIRSGSRISFTLIDLNGESGRRNGMASLALARPGVEATVSPAEETSVAADPAASEYRDLVQELVEALSDRWEGPPARIAIDAGLPAHTGFGSKTTTLLAVGRAYATLVGRDATIDEIAAIAGRAGTSGGTVNLLDHGGFVVDGGHANPPDFAADPKRYLVPSRFAGAARKKPPILIHAPFPAWPILVILTRGIHLHGDPELEFFQRTLPIPREEASRTAHCVLMQLAPAIVERDYDAFCRALNFITFRTYFKQKQIGMQSEELRELCRRAADDREIDAIGMSSEGPMCFAFARRLDEALEWLDERRAEGLVDDFFVSAATNHGAVITPVPPEGAKAAR